MRLTRRKRIALAEAMLFAHSYSHVSYCHCDGCEIAREILEVENVKRLAIDAYLVAKGEGK